MDTIHMTPTAMSDAVTNTAAAGVVLQTYCTEMAKQSNFIIPSTVVASLPALNVYLTTAKTHAAHYLDTLQPLIISVVTDVNAYSGQYTSFNTLVRQKIEVWKTGSDDGKKEAIVLMRATLNALSTKAKKTAEVQAALAAFQTMLNTDAACFSEGLTAASIIIGGNTGRLASLNKQLEEVNRQISGATTGVVLGVLGVVGGIVLICVGKLATIPTAGLSAALVLVGATLIVVGAGATAGASVALHKAKGMRSQLLTEQAQLNVLMPQINAIKGTASNLADGAKNASIQLTTMRNAWTLLGNDVNNICASLESAASWQGLPVGMQAWLSAAEGGWTGVQEKCGIIEQQMSGLSTVALKGPDGQLLLLTPENLRAYAERLAA